MVAPSTWIRILIDDRSTRSARLSDARPGDLMSRPTETLYRRFLAVRPRGEDGATAVEYAIIIALIAGVIILAVTLVGVKTGANFSRITDAWR